MVRTLHIDAGIVQHPAVTPHLASTDMMADCDKIFDPKPVDAPTAPDSAPAS